ncbi:MAG: 16S rRNA (guanine(527)-N(7))-methyltransferase RsmG [Rhodobacterales bacterium]|nr:16S rRNA (guanine(527)-N(7))-methyltransferase RsmG [Rhodobacterales bacterium]
MTQPAEACLAELSVSRETIAALRAFEGLVQRWSPAINLVSKASLADLWQRHILDSAQIFTLCPAKAATWVDVGSGGGFPGLVVAILAKELKPDLQVTLVESDLRKATFLRQAAQTLAVPVSVLSERIESVAPLAADVFSARALAPLQDLLAYADRHLAASGTGIFPKGARYAEELTAAKASWLYDVDVRPSLSEAEAAILVIRNLHRAHV